MDGNTTISVALLISVASIVFTALNYRRNAKKDDEEHQREKEKQVENRIKMNMKLDQLCTTTNDIRGRYKSNNRTNEKPRKTCCTCRTINGNIA